MPLQCLLHSFSVRLLFYFRTCGGVGIAVTEDVELAVLQHLAVKGVELENKHTQVFLSRCLFMGFLFREARDKNNKSATLTSAALSFFVSEMIT